MLRGRTREENEAFRAFCGGLALEMEFAAPAKGNEKGGVEGFCGFLEDNMFRPTPECESLDAFNLELEWFCRNDENRTSAAHRETIGERFAREQPQLRPLPSVLPTPCVRRIARINKFAEAICETNRYSVPTRWAHRDAVLEIFESRLRIVVDEQVVAEHKRCTGKHQTMLDVRHAIELLALKHRSVERAEIIAQSRLPAPLLALRDRLLEHDRASRPRLRRCTATVVGAFERGRRRVRLAGTDLRNARPGSDCAAGSPADDTDTAGGPAAGAARS